MKVEDFEFLSRLLKERSGLVVTKDKVYLLETRLMPVARRSGLKDLDELIQKLRTGRDDKLLNDVTEAMTTNESLFFRDTRPFDIFRDNVLPGMMKARAGQKKIRIWSAACSSGQEPYSLAILLKENQAKVTGWRFDIVATDLSKEIVAKAKAGLYTQFEVQRGLPIQLLVKYFKQTGDKWQIDAGLRSMVQYGEFNLLTHPRSLGQFDVVFCRNVLIYFDQPTKKKVLEGIADVMAKDGVLYLGGAETVLGVTDRFKPVQGLRGVYQRVDGEAAIEMG
ncbi:MAG: protein-glutamate O-methyltransferase [Marivibrio sp.]|uniref:CheR family methyltransferase n=1 Tax=Marivibrio sp. TaxID=2039719 RepID=UPI0032EEF1C2